MTAAEDIREFQLLVHPSAVASVEKSLKAYGEAYPAAHVDYRFDVHYKVTEDDIEVGQMWTNVIIRDRQLDQFAARVVFSSEARTDGTSVISTYYALASALSHIEQHGGYIKKGEPNSTADAVIARCRAPKPDREAVLPTTQAGIATCIEARDYLKAMTATSDFEQRVQEVANKEFVEEREVALLAAGANTYWRHLQAMTARAAKAAPRPVAAPAAPAPAVQRASEWLGQLGDDLVVAGTVIEVKAVGLNDRRFGWDRKLVVFETMAGDRVRAFGDVKQIAVGDLIGVRGDVSAHTYSGSRKVTLINEASIGKSRLQTQSEWLARPGENLAATGVVLEVKPVGLGDPRFGINRRLIVFQTVDGDHVRVFADVADVALGDVVGARGFVSDHTYFGGHKVTVIKDGYVTVSSRTAR